MAWESVEWEGVEWEGIKGVWLVVVRVGDVWREGIGSVAIRNGGSGTA